MAALAWVTAADAEIVNRQDESGRTIRFDVRTEGADVDFYAGLLSWASHGDEISDVTIRIVDPVEVQNQCGAAALACYGDRRGVPTIVMPAGTGSVIAQTMLHEYGHHLDTAWDVPSVPDLEGTPVWWSSRGMAELLNDGMVAFDYSRGWNRSVAEIFAEDYAYIHLPVSYGIPWLSPPDDALKAAMFAELGDAPTTAPPTSATVRAPLVISRTGRLAARRRFDLPFGLLGPGRHVTLTVNLSGSNRAGTRARAQVICNNTVVATQTFGRGRVQRVLDIRSLGPAECRARLISTSGAALQYTMRLRLAVES